MRAMYRLAALCVLPLLTAQAQSQTWQVAKQESGIEVSLSKVPGSDYKAYKGVATIQANLAKVQALQEDVSGACAWIHECKTQKLLKVEGAKSWTYSQFSTPWPVTPRDSIIEVTTEVDQSGAVTRTLKGVPTYLPEEKGFVRVAEVEGYWKLEPKGPNVTLVTYQVHTEPGGSVPSMIANKFVVDAPFNTLKNLKARAEQP